MSDDSQGSGGGKRLSAPVYEMLWNCEYCGATKLLGKTHRHCPQCGAAQDPASRYFPPEEEKVAVQDHVYYGVDWSCDSCQTPNSNASAFCGNCGTPKDGQRKVDLAHDKAKKAAQDAPPPEPVEKSSGGGFGKGIIGCVVLIFGALMVICCMSMFWTKSATLQVTGHSWERSIEVEVYGPTAESDWCDEMPSGAYSVSQTEKQRDTRRVEDGQDCSTVNVDNGDGTFSQEQECTTRYREEAIYDAWCSYTVDTWSTERTARANGGDLSPSWPDPKVQTCSSTRQGCQREGTRSQTYTVHFSGDGDTHSCDFSESQWRSFQAGASVEGEVSMVTGGLQCSSLK